VLPLLLSPLGVGAGAGLGLKELVVVDWLPATVTLLRRRLVRLAEGVVEDLGCVEVLLGERPASS
jgi:hypothetical protein